MSPRLPAVKPLAVADALERDGWVLFRQRGSHRAYRKPGNPAVITISIHNRDMKPGTLRHILRLAELSDERFVELLRA